ncbi:MAG: class I SAM-dependent methyltransferase [bacterium]
MNDISYSSINMCRSCSSEKIEEFINLGKQPLANGLKKSDSQTDQLFPLRLLYCHNCTLVQLGETVDQERLFQEYFWVTGTSETAKKYADVFFKKVVSITALDPKSTVIEIASNDGTFLYPFGKHGYNILGIDPAKNIAEIANANGIPTWDVFWNTQTAEKVKEKHGPADIVFARNVIPHVSELHEVIKGIRHVLKKDGVGIIEFHSAATIQKELHYDSIYHEHLSYFSLKSLSALLGSFLLYPFHVEESPISGGSFVLFFSLNSNRKQTALLKEKYLLEEKNMINDINSWINFATSCMKHSALSKELIKPYLSKTIIGYGASARSSTYLNYCQFDHSVVKAIIDKNRLKQGYYTPGTSIPIISLQQGLAYKPDMLFVLGWNFKDEILNECSNAGFKGPFLIPFPQKPYMMQKVN